MTTKNKLLTLLIVSSGAAAATALINKAIQIQATSKNLFAKKESLCFKWRLGDVRYTKQGTGKPLLLIHNLSPSASSYEWSSVAEDLAEDYTVYTIDLLGCGQSEKPNLTYTNYLYVQLISDFIKSEIGHRTDVVVTGASCALAIMACSNSPELFDRLVLINPESILTCSQVPGKRAKLYKFTLDLPILGTLIYNIATSRTLLREMFEKVWFFRAKKVNAQLLDTYFEAAHLGESPKSIYASVRTHYTKCNIINALRRIDNSICLIGGEEIEGISERFDEYREYNPAVESTLIADTRLLPQLESPEKTVEAIRTYLA